MKLYITLIFTVIALFSSIFAPANAGLYYHLKSENKDSQKNIRFANYNISWLSASYILDHDRIYLRKNKDFQNLKKIIKQLNADIIALQEINDIQSLSKLISPKDYNLILANSDNPQKTGFAIAKHLKYKRIDDLEDLAYIPQYPNSLLRKATDIALYLEDGTQIRLLSIHLKSGCFSVRTSTDEKECNILQKQFEILQRWVNKRLIKGENFIIMGDFNRRFFALDPFIISFQDLIEKHNYDISPGKIEKYNELIIPSIETGGRPLCWKRRYAGFIDHFIIGLRKDNPLEINSFGEYLYDNSKKFRQDARKLSDHCPVFVDFFLEKR